MIPIQHLTVGWSGSLRASAWATKAADLLVAAVREALPRGDEPDPLFGELADGLEPESRGMKDRGRHRLTSRHLKPVVGALDHLDRGRLHPSGRIRDELQQDPARKSDLLKYRRVLRDRLRDEHRRVSRASRAFNAFFMTKVLGSSIT